ncbi:Sorting nexin-17 [Pseudolycoriella hygida]|uniref:Sorting nexin-17 n=1 Tax=Pseudolycoriella hygida TaxID=35572 RepID=A0A9Q0N857_9DIPT|nr:Sorting nexin-17 [Pseudolycoriella hygida]
MSKSCLKWITIASEQAMLMFVCLQNMVDELLNKKDGNDFNNIKINRSNHTNLSYIRRDGKNRRISESSSSDTISSLNEIDMPLQFNSESLSMRRRLNEKISTTVLYRKSSVHNEAFEEIGDDDL